MGVIERWARMYRQTPNVDAMDRAGRLIAEDMAAGVEAGVEKARAGQAPAADMLRRIPRALISPERVPSTQARPDASRPPVGEAPAGLRRYLEPTETEMRADAVTWAGAPSAVETADTRRPLPVWSPEYKLRHALARPALAHQLVEALPVHLAVELAEVVEGLFERRMRVVEAAVVAQTEHVLARMREDAEAKLQEVHDERYRGNSRLS